MELQQRRPTTEDRPVAVDRLTPQELAVFKDCMQEGFYRRSLPIGTVFAAAAYAACQTGYWKKNPKWGATLKVMGMTAFGYFVGKVLYYQTCYQRVLNVPGGALAAKLRERQGNKDSLDPGFMSLGGFDTSTPASQPLDPSSVSSLNLDLDTVRVSEPEFTRPYAEDFTFQENKTDESLLYRPPVTSYDELRKQNRDQYEAQRSVSSQSARQYKPPPSSVLLEPEERAARKKKNLYGDDMDP